MALARERDVLRFGMSSGELIARGIGYQQHLADGAVRFLAADAGAGFASWPLPDPIGDFAGPVQVATSGVPRPTPQQLATLMALMPDHPLYQSTSWSARKCARVGDLVRLAAFWETPLWTDVHGIYENRGRYPAVVQFGWLGGQFAFLGLHREYHDFTDEEMPLLELLSDMLRPAFAFRHAMDAATSRIQAFDGFRDPERRLTQREAEVLSLVARGWTSARIGTVLGITERTVRKHLGNVNEKLSVSSRTAAAVAWTAMNSCLSPEVPST